MKTIMLAAIGYTALALPMIATPASAYVVRKSVTMHHGPMGHGCRTVRTVKRTPMGKKVIVRKICR